MYGMVTIRPEQGLPALSNDLEELGALYRLVTEAAEKSRLKPIFVAASFSAA